MKTMFSVAGQMVRVRYTNHRGETADRDIWPLSIFFGSTAWHPEPQWLLHAWDPAKRGWRDFALKDMAPVAPDSRRPK